MCGDCISVSSDCVIHYNSHSYDNMYFRPVIREEATQNEVMGDDTDELRISRMEDEILEEGGGADSDEGGDDGGTFLDFTSTAKHGKQVWRCRRHAPSTHCTQQASVAILLKWTAGIM